MMRHNSQTTTSQEQQNKAYPIKIENRMGALKIDDSPRAREEIFLVIKPSEKTKVAKEGRREVGFEYDNDVTSDILLCQKILQTNNYNPTNENIIDFSDDFSRILATSQTSDSRNAGTVIGMAIFGTVGFVALSFTIVGALAGGILGVGMGRYAGRKLTKKMKRKKAFNNEELFRLKLQCLLKMGQIQQTEMKHNLNKYRLQLEKILQEFAYVFDLSLFEKPKKLSTILTKLHNFLLNVTNQKAILLSYKLLKNYLKLSQGSIQEIETEITSKVYSVFLPFKKALEFSVKKDKKLHKITSYVKINDFLQKPEIQEIMRKNKDPYAESNFLREFKEKLREPVDIEQKIGDLKKVREVINNIHDNPDETHSPPNNAQQQLRKTVSQPAQTSQNDKETPFDQGAKFDEKDLEEDISVSFTMNHTNSIKLNAARFKVDSLSPARSKILNDPIRSPSKHHTQPLRADHSLLQSNSAGPSMTKSAFKTDTKFREQKSPNEVESSDDSSNDDGENEEEQKRMMEDSYLFNSHQKKPQEHKSKSKTRDGFQLLQDEEIGLKEQQNDEGRGRRLSERVKNPNNRPHSESKFGLARENFQSLLVKMLSEPEVEDPDFESSSRKSLADLQRAKSNSARRVDLEVDQSINIKNQQETKQVESKPEPEAVKKPIDTKQEIIFQKLLSISADTHSKWDVIKNDKDLKVFKIKPENSDVVLIKAWAIIHDVTPRQVFNSIYDAKIRNKWDTVLSNPHVVEKIDDYHDYFYFCVKAPFPVSNRDFVQKRCYQLDYPEKGDIIISFQSTTHPKAPPIKGNVRGETHIAGYIIKGVNNGKDTELHVITQVDVKGSIPKVVVNFVAGRAPAEWILKLKKACQSLGK